MNRTSFLISSIAIRRLAITMLTLALVSVARSQTPPAQQNPLSNPAIDGSAVISDSDGNKYLIMKVAPTGTPNLGSYEQEVMLKWITDASYVPIDSGGVLRLSVAGEGASQVEILNASNSVVTLPAEWAKDGENNRYIRSADNSFIAPGSPLTWKVRYRVGTANGTSAKLHLDYVGSSYNTTDDGEKRPTINLLPVELRDIEFHGNQTIKKDDGSGDYTGKDWQDNSNPADSDADDAGDQKWPICYVKGDTIGVSSIIKCAGANGMTAKIRAKAKGPNLKDTGQNELEFGPSPAITISSGEIALPRLDANNTVNPNIVNYIDNLEVKWEISLDNEATWAEVGNSKHALYALYQQPITANKLYHTVIHLACSTPGASTWNQVVSNVWANLSGPGNVKAWNPASRSFNRSLHYYENGIAQQNVGKTTERLLLDGNGQCDAWMSLFLDALKIHGEPTSQAIQVNGGADEALFLLVIKNWTVTPSSPQPPHILLPTIDPDLSCSQGNGTYGDMISEAGVAGQNTPTPYVKIFGGHAIAQYGDTYYDPSYGTTYSGPQDFENAVIVGYGVQNSNAALNEPADITVRGPDFSAIIFGPVSYP